MSAGRARVTMIHSLHARRIGWFHAAVFVSSFLLFQIQPMLSKALLPGFGGGTLVWGASMVFFQGVLLAGYAFSHVAQRRLGVARYARVHLVLMLLPLLCYPFDFDWLAQAGGDGHPALRVLHVLLLSAAAPFLMLSTVSLVLQRWLGSSGLPERRNPYVLYAVSNVGSVLALLSYPLLVEPFVDLVWQGRLWWCGYLLLCLLQAGSFAVSQRGAQSAPAGVTPVPARLAPGAAVRWLLLSMAGCAALLAVTNVLTFDVAAVPFLWVLPLCLYLGAFIITFKARMWFPPAAAAALYWAVPCGVLLHILGLLRLALPPGVTLLVHLGILFTVCWSCAARLVQTRPTDDAHLTGFYLVLAAGGLLGSLVVSWVVPPLSTTLVEYPLALALTLGAVGLCGIPAGSQIGGRRMRIGVLGSVAAVLAVLLLLPPAAARLVTDPKLLQPVLVVLIGLPLALLLRAAQGRPLRMCLLVVTVCAAGTWIDQSGGRDRDVLRLRNYYGIYRVYDREGIRLLQHGTTQHGRQYLDPERAGTPLAYFHPTTPAAGVLQHPTLPKAETGMIGLGTGALAAYAGAGQRLTIHELDPDNQHIAESLFGYLDQARRQGARIDYVFGDGRVTLRDRPAGTLDILIIDAFSSGAIPVHLLTVEAFGEYLRVLKAEGILLLHVSNKVLDLLPVVYSNAAALDVLVCENSNAGRLHPDAELTDWAALTRSPEAYRVLRHELSWWRRETPSAGWPRPWTDRYSNLFGAIVW